MLQIYEQGACKQAEADGLGVQVNLGGILAWEFLLMHWVEVRRWQDIRKPGSVNEVSQSPVTQSHRLVTERHTTSRNQRTPATC